MDRPGRVAALISPGPTAMARGDSIPYRHFQAAAAFNQRSMPDEVFHFSTPRRRRDAAIGLHLTAICAAGLLVSCDAPKELGKPSPATVIESSPQLATARIELAQAHLDANSPDKALVHLVSALTADPGAADALSMAAEILAGTRWHLPETTLDHGVGLRIDRIEFSPPSSLWVGLGGGISTLARWNLETATLGNMLFPIKADGIRSLVFDPGHKSMVMERAGVSLLCDAQTLKPIRDIGLIPDWVTPSSVFVFSPDGLLLGHPARVSDEDASLVWRLRDTTSGEIIRSSDPIPADRAKPIAAYLNRQNLRVLHADGSLLDMPVSPVEPPVFTPAAEPRELLHAQFAENGGSALALRLPGTHLEPELFLLPMGEGDRSSLETGALLERFPWSRHPGLWTGLLGESKLRPLEVDGSKLTLSIGRHAPIHAGSTITAVAVSGDHVIVGDDKGMLTFHLTLPLLGETNKPPSKAPVTPAALAALGNLTRCLTGLVYEENKRAFYPVGTESRMRAYQACDMDAIAKLVPELDFRPLTGKLDAFTPKTIPQESFAPLTDRLARTTDPEPGALQDLEAAFENADDEAVLKAIKAAGNKGPAAAKALELALNSTQAGLIEAVLLGMEDLPPLLNKLATSRIAWLQDRKADAIAGWPDVFPTLDQVRLREDWDGWEQADYSLALEKLRLCVSEELDAIEVPENSTPEQRKAVFERLDDPATVRAVGKARYAKACLKAALAFSGFKDETATTFRLASIARGLGEAAEPCLRAEALALTALGDYQNARERWVTLITEHPVETHLPGDYAEAAYTSFENADPRQAMEILTTGLHRFPNDANFALRAGWVALLTGNAERAYRFLLTGRQIGYPEEKLENAIALMAIAAVQTGADEDAAVFYQDLIRMDPAWQSPDTIETLEWPEELKASLRQLVW